MAANKKRTVAIIAIGFLLFLLIALAATNPSESRHCSRIAAELAKRDAEHIAKCPKCAGTKPGPVRDEDDILLLLVRADAYYHNLYLLSYVSDGGLSRAKTLGIGGFVFGPVFYGPDLCPKDMGEPPPLRTSFKHEIHVAVRSDGRIFFDAKEIPLEMLLKQLAELPDKEESLVTLHAGLDLRIVKQNEIMDHIRSLGFHTGMEVIPDDAEDDTSRK